jgi:hypothetical protein
MTRTRADGVPLSSGQAGTEYAALQIEMQNEMLRKKAEGSTFFQHAIASANDEAGARYAKQNPTAVVGANPIAYPQLPEGSPWARQWPEGPDEFGVEIDAMEPVGSDKEIEEAAEILRSRSATPLADDDPAAVPGTSLTVERVTGSPTNSPSVDLSAVVMGGPVNEATVAGSPTSSQSPPITNAAVGGDARGRGAANNTVPRSFTRRI